VTTVGEDYYLGGWVVDCVLFRASLTLPFLTWQAQVPDFVLCGFDWCTDVPPVAAGWHFGCLCSLLQCHMFLLRPLRVVLSNEMAFWTTCTLDCRPLYCPPSMRERRMPGDVPHLCHCNGTLAAARAHLAANAVLTSPVRRACCIVACCFVTACPFVLSNCMLPTAVLWR